MPLTLQMTTARGDLKGHIEVYFPNGTLKFFGVDFEVFPSPETAEIESKDEFTLLESKFAEVDKIIAEGIETAQGKSAYEIAVENGFVGTVEEWIESLVGAKGEPGVKGDPGTDGKSITSTEINESGELVLTYSDGSAVNVGVVKGKSGIDGKNYQVETIESTETTVELQPNKYAGFNFNDTWRQVKMAEFLAYRIISGKLTLDKVPSILKDKVKQALDELGYTEPTESEV